MPVDFGRLFDDPDLDYRAAVWALVDEVERVRIAINKELEADARLRARAG